MQGDPVDIDDIEAFIFGLKNSFDSLGDIKSLDRAGFQAKIAKAISALRVKKMDKIEPIPKEADKLTGDGLKNFLINKLEQLRTVLESDPSEISKSRKFKLVMDIAKLRETINYL